MVGARVRRQQVAYAQGRGLSSRRACALLSVARSALDYQSRLALQDAPVIAAMRALAAQYPRYGYRKIRIFLGRQGHVMGVVRDGASPRAGHARSRRPRPITCGPTTSSSTPAPTVAQ